MDVNKPISSKDKPEDSNKSASSDIEEDQEVIAGEDGGEELGEEDGESDEEEEAEEEQEGSDSDYLEEIDVRELKKLTPTRKSTNQNLNVPPVKEELEEPSNDLSLDKVDPQQEEKELDRPPKDLDDALVPRLGMVFNSVDDAFSYFRAYAFKKGFTAIKRTGHNFEGIRYRSMFSCNQAGKPGEGRSRSRKRPNSRHPLRQREPRSIKTECPAMMVIKDEMLEDKWKVVSLHLEHNHPCTSDMIRFVKCFREIPELVRKQRSITDEMAESVEQLFNEITENFKYPTRPKKGELEELGLPPFGEVEIKALVKFFSNAQSKKPDFYHSWDLDEEGRIKHVFWADARSRAAYRYFNDVITIEQTRIAARMSVPLIAIVGVNNHGQLVLLGCGILADESKESFLWLLKKWLRCMGGHLPEAVTTDYRKAVTEAVAEVIPSARHRYCVWHILKSLGEKLTTEKVQQKEIIITEIKKVIYEILSVTDFEKGWKELVDRFKLGEDEWLSQLYEQRKKWAPVYVNHMFWAGTSAVRRTAEKPDAFFDGLISTKSTLQQFLDQYDGFIKAKLEKEAFEDLRSFYSRQQFMSGLQFEEQIGELYTRNIFHLFQDEVKRLMQVICNEPDRKGTSVTYTVSELAEGKKVDFTVVYNPSDKDVWCICRSFQSRGILCSHTLAVLRTEYVMVIPNKYIMDRWRKDFKLSLAGSEVARLALVPARELSNYDDLYNRGHRFFTDLIEIGAREPEMRDFVLTVVKEARDRMIRYDESQFGTGGERRGVDVNMASTAAVTAVPPVRNGGGAHPYNMVNVNLENEAPIAMIPTNFMQVHHPHQHQHQHQHHPQHPHQHQHQHQHQPQHQHQHQHQHPHPHQHSQQQVHHPHAHPALVPQKRGSTSKTPNLERNPYFIGGGMHVG